jgi:hypothetical protein
MTTKINQSLAGKNNGKHNPFGEGGLHPSWLAFIRHCRELGFGEVSHLKIQDGLPVMAEEIIKKIKFS